MEHTDVLIIVNRGGWGNGGLELEEEARSILEGIQQTLSSLNLRYRIFVFERSIKVTPFKALFLIKKLVGGYRKEAEMLSKRIERLIASAGNSKILLLGYSNGGVLNIQTMKRLLSYPQVYALNIGTPFIAKHFLHPRVLDVRKSYDFVARGHIFTFLPAVLMGFLVAFMRMLSLKTIHPTKAFHIPGHYYVWADENIRKKVQEFIKIHFGSH